jgi:hypothetical protein
MPRNAPERYGRTVAVSLTDQQTVVLQAIYDHFREHGRWPTFITIDRPIRRRHHWDTGPIILSLPESLIVPPRQGMPPIASDELRLRLLGIQACDGSSDDLELFIQTLHWLAEREETYEPLADSGDEMPQVTSQEIADHLGLGDADPLPLQRLYAMLDLDHWGIGGSSRSENGWSVRLMPDIWRFREVHSVEDCMAVREAWLAEGRPAVLTADETAQDAYFHVRLGMKGRSSKYRVLPDLSLEALDVQILAPYRSGHAIVADGDIIQLTDIIQIRIVQTDRPTKELPRRRTRRAQGVISVPSNDDWSLATTSGTDVTNDFITGAPGQLPVEVVEPVDPSAPAQARSPYVDEKVIEAIRAKDGQSKFDVTKLLTLIDELNDNYARQNTYGSHALLRGLLDHIPPILGQPHFDAVASSYRWSVTDKKYMKQLAAFRAQGDDALHRQISTDADLLGFDDMPKSVCVDQLLLECAKRL